MKFNEVFEEFRKGKLIYRKSWRGKRRGSSLFCLRYPEVEKGRFAEFKFDSLEHTLTAYRIDASTHVENMLATDWEFCATSESVETNLRRQAIEKFPTYRSWLLYPTYFHKQLEREK
jgi:hypothetical protein